MKELKNELIYLSSITGAIYVHYVTIQDNGITI